MTALRTREHADRILDACQSGLRCVCIGGGLLGLETAGALAQRGMDVTLLEGHGWLLPRQLNQRTGGQRAGERRAEFAGIPRSNMLKVLGYDLFSIGQIHPQDASYEIIEGELDGGYFYFVFRDSHMVSSILLRDTSLAAATKEIVEKQIDCSKVLQRMPDVRDILDFVAQHQ